MSTNQPDNREKDLENDATDSTDTLIFGCGYLGLRVAQRLKFASNRVDLDATQAAKRVWGVTRSEGKAERLEAEGILPIIADWTDSQTLRQLPDVDRILVAVSYDRRSQYSRQDSQIGGLTNLLQNVAPTCNVCYISTTGVYHQTDGQWVDETSPCEPEQAGGQVHLAAEQLLQQMRPESPWTVLRLSGIYGPGRIPRVADVLAGRPIATPQDGFLNLIHVDDAADAVINAWTNASERLYLISDDRPVVRGDFYREIAKQFGAPPPTFVEPAPDTPVKMRSKSNKRIRNERMKEDLLATLKYPSFEEGIRAIVRSS